ncbi:MAG TPA: ChaN family lipoprotein [Longimicrobium sp.]|nr:ChaN family lipoprotein [Longimicrobium sp.]
MRSSRLSALLLPLVMPIAAPASSAAQMDYAIVQGGSGRPMGLMELADSLARHDVVFLGEQHDDPVTHRVQAILLDEIGRRRPRVVLSLEMFERDVQPLVDDYAADRLAEADFLARSRPWGNYAEGYRPLVERARAWRWPVVAANVPRPLASSVSRGGMAVLDTLPASHAGWYAAELRCEPQGEYFRRFGEAMGGMQGHGAGADSAAARATLARFYAAQCLKDETMAESIARARQAAPDAVVVHVTGAFHSNGRLGTVERLVRRMPALRIAVVTLAPVDDPRAGDAAEHAGSDYVVFTRRPPPAAP